MRTFSLSLGRHFPVQRPQYAAPLATSSISFYLIISIAGGSILPQHFLAYAMVPGLTARRVAILVVVAMGLLMMDLREHTFLPEPLDSTSVAIEKEGKNPAKETSVHSIRRPVWTGTTPSAAIPSSAATLLQDVAFVMVAFGKASQTQIVERATESIRRVGHFHGPIIIITDAPKERYESTTDPALMVYSTQIPEELTGIEKTMAYKRFKTNCIDVVNSFSILDSINVIVYMDIDIVVGRDLLSFAQFAGQTLRSCNQRRNNTNDFSFLLTMDRREEKVKREIIPEYYHSGVMVIHRLYSVGCLQAWQKVIESGRFHRDQQALTHAVLYPTQEGLCQVTTIPREHFMLMPTTESMKSGTTSTFIHVTNGKRARHIEGSTQVAFFRHVLGLNHTYAGPI
jgi:hypothetical protein